MDRKLEEALQAFSDMSPEAFSLMLVCADMGYAQAIDSIITMLAEGCCAKKDLVQADHWKKKLIELGASGDREAQWLLSLRYRFADNFAFDQATADYWLERSAERGNPDAELQLALYLMRGDYSFSRNEELGLQWLDRAVEHGGAEAKYYKANLLIKAGGPTPEAIALLRAAAKLNLLAANETLDQYGISIDT